MHYPILLAHKTIVNILKHKHIKMAYLKINVKVVFCLLLMSLHTLKRKTELSQAMKSLHFSVAQTHTHTHKAEKVRAVNFQSLI